MYEELNAFINFQSEQRDVEREKLISELPERLKLELSNILYKEYRKHIYFLREVNDNKNFVSWLCPLLQPL